MWALQDMFNNTSVAPPADNARATIDPDRLLEANEQIRKLLEDENKNRDLRLQHLADSRIQFTQALDAIEDRKRMMHVEHLQRITLIAITIADGVQGLVKAPKTARFS